MRIGRLFAVSMLSVTALAVVLGAGVLLPQYRTFASKTEAINAVAAYGAVLAVGQQIAGYRAPYVTRYGADLMTRPACYSIARARTELGWQPRVGIQEGVRRALEWYCSLEANRHLQIKTPVLTGTRANPPGS